ncbi:MAG: permease [Bacteroidales bacterium]|nr:permease [Bacteroidales bacterium]
MISTLLNTLLESAPYVILGFIIAGILKFWVPQDILQKHLGSNSPGSLFKSVGIGSILPLCSCGTIPLGIGLFRSGAAIGNILAFMTSTPILSPVLIALSLSFLGVKLTVTFVAVAILGAFAIGFLGNRIFIDTKKTGQQGDTDKQYNPDNDTAKQPKSKIHQTIKWSFFDLGADVSVDVTIGLSIAALLLALLPMEWISSWLGQQDVFTLFYVILLGIPVYACSIPSIPVVQGLLLLGATPGAAVAYMIAGPATNLGELNAIRRSMGIKPAVYYTIALIVLALVAGMITDQLVYPDYQYHAYRVQGELVVQQCCVPLIFGEGIGTNGVSAHIPVWHWPFAIILFGVIIYGIYIKLRHFILNPCKTCTWKVYGKDGFCGSRCHVRRKYDFLNQHFKA